MNNNESLVSRCCLLIIVLFAILLNNVNAECCGGIHEQSVGLFGHQKEWDCIRHCGAEFRTFNLANCCGDCTCGTPYCGIGGCNMFGCHCDNGCRSGDCGVDQRRRLKSIDYFNQLDINSDNKLDINEVFIWFKNSTKSKNISKLQLNHHFIKLDLNNDGHINPNEFDSDLH